MLELDFCSLSNGTSTYDGNWATPPHANHYACLQIDGADAPTFLQGQLTFDIEKLAVNHNCLAAVCNPQGRVIATMDLLRDEYRFLAIVPYDVAEAVINHLQRYVLRSKVTIAILTGSHPIVATTQVPDSLAIGECHFTSQHFLYRPTWLSEPAANWMITNQPLDPSMSEPEDLSIDQSKDELIGEPLVKDPKLHSSEISWAQAHLLWGFAHINGATSKEHIAQMLNLDLLDAISFTKGCYTGQEIIARIHHRGKVKRRLQRYVTPVTLKMHYGEPLLTQEGKVAGNVIEFATDRHQHTGLLAVVKLDALGTNLSIQDTVLVNWSLPYSIDL